MFVPWGGEGVIKKPLPCVCSGTGKRLGMISDLMLSDALRPRPDNLTNRQCGDACSLPGCVGVRSGKSAQRRSVLRQLCHDSPIMAVVSAGRR